MPLVTFGDPSQIIRSSGGIGGSYGFYIDDQGDVYDGNTWKKVGHVDPSFRDATGDWWTSYEQLQEAAERFFGEPAPTYRNRPPGDDLAPPTPIDNPNDPFWQGVGGGALAGAGLGVLAGGGGGSSTVQPPPVAPPGTTGGGFPGPSDPGAGLGGVGDQLEGGNGGVGLPGPAGLGGLGGLGGHGVGPITSGLPGIVGGSDSGTQPPNNVPTSTSGSSDDDFWKNILGVGLLGLGGGLGSGAIGGGGGGSGSTTRNLIQEGTDTLNTQITLAPDQLKAIQDYSGPYAKNYLDIAKILGGGLGDLSAQLNSQNRTATMGDVSKLAGEYTKTIRDANADYFTALDRFSDAAQKAVNPSASQQQFNDKAAGGFGTYTAPQGNSALNSLLQRSQGSGQSPLLAKQNEVAIEQLGLGGNLSPTELRAVQQASRAGFAARGLGATNASVVDETFQTDAARRQRLLQALGIASGVEAQNQSSSQIHNQLGLGASAQALGYDQLALAGFGQNSANTAAQLQALQNAALLAEQQRQSQVNQQQNALTLQRSSWLDPFAAITGATNETILPQTLQGTTGVSNFVSNNFNPFAQYSDNVFDFNANAAIDQQTQRRNQINALGSGLFGLGSKLIFG